MTERGDEGIARIKYLTNGIGAASVLECVGTEESMIAGNSAYPAGRLHGYIGVPGYRAMDERRAIKTLLRP